MITKEQLRSFLLGTFCCFFVTTLHAQNAPSYGTWGFDSNKQSTAQTAPESDPSDYQKVYSLLVAQADRWNAHDLDGYLDTYWKSPDLLLVVEGEQLKGWANVVATYHRGYTNLDEMGSITPERIQIQMVTPDVAIALDWWTAHVKRSKILGTSTMVFRKFDDGWKVVVGHTSFVEP
jgi:uncharacterized protein (TIGR02246 family)